jgi:hypothetical protein
MAGAVNLLAAVAVGEEDEEGASGTCSVEADGAGTLWVDGGRSPRGESNDGALECCTMPVQLPSPPP